jgi:hypothetical protein
MAHMIQKNQYLYKNYQTNLLTNIKILVHLAQEVAAPGQIAKTGQRERRSRMLSYSHDIVLADAQERRSRLLAEAAAHRLARLTQRPAAECSGSPRLQARLLAAAGTLLVQWGKRLQAAAQTNLPAAAGIPDLP